VSEFYRATAPRPVEEAIMADLQLTLTTDERHFLQNLLERTLKDTLIEEHRTRTLSYREYVVHNEEIIQAVLTKLQQSPS
jgi:hypothetical protein